LRAQVAERERLEQERRLAEQREAELRKSSANQQRPSPVPWIVGGVGVAAIATGVVTGLIARGKENDAVGEPEQLAAAHDLDVAHGYATAANVLFVAGSALVASGVVLFFVLRPHTSVAMGPTGLRLGGTF